MTEINLNGININYQLEGEGIRYQLVAFLKAIHVKKNRSYVDKSISVQIAEVINNFYTGKGMYILHI